MDLTLLSISLAKLVAKLTLAPAPGAVTETLLDIVAAAVPDRRQQRSLTRQFEALGDRIAYELEPFFSAEFGGLPANEKSAAMHALLDGLSAAALSRDKLLQHDVDPRRLETSLRPFVHDPLLDPSAQSFLDVLLHEACVLIVACLVATPDFQAYTAVEILRREREIAEAIDAAIVAIPKAVLSSLAETDPRRFEIDYRREIVRRFDNLTVFGLPVREERFKRYPLTVAYLSLAASRSSGSGSGEDRIERILSEHRRVVIRGDAGSGKTTLLQWLAVRAAQQSFSGALHDWNAFVPLYVPLRRFVRERTLPPAGRFADYAAGVLADSIPEHWVTDLLANGRALVLLDGLDELSTIMLREVQSWMNALIHHYPDNIYVVTSRPYALGTLSLRGDGFSEATLIPMTQPDIFTFIDQWHRAASRAITDETDLERLRDCQTRLEAALASTRELQSLAHSPLLCALLCTLNRDRDANLPRDRLTLYALALEMLVSRRDAERGISPDAPVSYAEAVLLLQEIAYWMLRNGHTSITQFDFQFCVERRLPAMRHVRADAEAVASYLLKRSGVLREPVDGEVDFIHLTFRDYLAAQGILATEDVRVLLREARQGRWPEVVVFAAGLATQAQQRRIFQGLLFDQVKEDAPDGTTRIAFRVRPGQEFLALACIEVSTSVDPEVSSQVRDRVAALVPPDSLQSARLLAAAGESAVRALGRVLHTVPRDQACYTVAALAATGDPSALPQLAEWARDPRPEVRLAVADTWSSFSPRRFAEAVLPAFAEAHPTPPITVNGAQLRWVKDATWIRALTVLAPTAELDLRDLPLEGLVTLSIEGFAGVRLEGLGDARAVQELSIGHARQLEQLVGLGNLDAVRRVRLEQLPSLIDLAELTRCATLEAVELAELPRIRRLSLTSPIRSLMCRRCEGLEEVEIAHPEHLETLIIDRVPVRRLAAPPGDWGSLRHVRFADLQVSRMPPLGTSRALETLEVESCTQLRSLEWLAGLSGIKHLSLSGCVRVSDLAPLADLPDLEHLDLSFCRGVEDLTALRDLANLRSVNLTGCSITLDLAPISHLEDIEFPYPA